MILLVFLSLFSCAAHANPVDVSRANAAQASFLRQFYIPDVGRFRQMANWPGYRKDRQADFWFSAEALQAVLDHYALTRRATDLQVLEAFTHGRLAGGFVQPPGQKYYDDENWMVEALETAYELTGDKKYLAGAQLIFKDVQTGWDTSCCGANLGGVWWSAAHTEKSAIANAGAAMTAAKLYRLTGQKKYLAFADKVYGFWLVHGTKITPDGDRLVYGPILKDGTIGKKLLTYNQGMMAYAAVELYLATHKPGYLTQARAFADGLMRRLSMRTPYGRVMVEGVDMNHEPQTGTLGQFWRDKSQFKGVAMRCLAKLYRVDHDPSLLSFMDSTAQSLWNQARDPKTGLFAPAWESKTAGIGGAVISQQSAAVEALVAAAEIKGSHLDKAAH